MSRLSTGRWTALLALALVTAGGAPAAAAIKTIVLTGDLPTHSYETGASDTVTPYDDSAAYSELAPSFDSSLGELRKVVITETLTAVATSSWTPIFRPGTNQVVIPPVADISVAYASSLGAPLDIDLGMTGASAFASIDDIDDSSAITTTKTVKLSGASTLSAFLDTSGPLYFVRTYTASGGLGRVQSASTGAGGGYKTTIAYFYKPFGAAVPEPASWALLIGGFGLAGAALRRRGPRTA